MLVVYYGNDTVGVRDAAFTYVEEQKGAGMSTESVPLEALSAEVLTDAATGSSLFGGASVYVIDTPSQKAEVYETVLAGLPELAASEHTFVIIEGALLAAEKKKFAKHASKIEEYKQAAADRFNTFALADALAKKDKRTLWLLLTQARAAGIADEELIGILWWQLKALRLAESTNTAAEAGMKDFPYRKATQALGNFKTGEVTVLSQRLLTLYHDARAGRTDMDVAFERWVLTL